MLRRCLIIIMIKESSNEAGRRLERPCLVMQISLLGSKEEKIKIRSHHYVDKWQGPGSCGFARPVSCLPQISVPKSSSVCFLDRGQHCSVGLCAGCSGTRGIKRMFIGMLQYDHHKSNSIQGCSCSHSNLSPTEKFWDPSEVTTFQPTKTSLQERQSRMCPVHKIHLNKHSGD